MNYELFALIVFFGLVLGFIGGRLLKCEAKSSSKRYRYIGYQPESELLTQPPKGGSGLTRIGRSGGANPLPATKKPEFKKIPPQTCKEVK
ncbi:hypothetical protein SAMN06269117_11461 [Balnearium lithotrophicum]|uniref:Uncharacterized protein n=1 Tax=Balnearium lithotrophicum TaxID=223788 RepID=A0A521CR96_9BACT|nr:hypothetical protein [Balnearium lithotrophicum]SMO61962.1 hypothetical protein SAMN06269117_11461 [Balnearium lithotrophicum]